VAVPLTFIINNSLEEGTVPVCWKKARLHPVYKNKGSRKDMKSYRPISILSSPSKILEAVAKDQLSSQTEQLSVIPGIQHGFRKGRSTVTAVAALEHDLKKQPNQTRGDCLMVPCCLKD